MVIPPQYTPLLLNGRAVNLAALGNQIHNLARAGITTLFCNSETGGFRENSFNLRGTILLWTHSYASQHGLDIVNSVTPGVRETPETIERYMTDSGDREAAGIVVCLKYPFIGSDEDEAKETIYLGKASDSWEKDVLVYENPGICDGRMSSVAQIRDIASISNVVGAKVSSGYDQVINWIENTPHDFLILIGDQSIYEQVFDYCREAGISRKKIGIVPSYANFMPEFFISYLETGGIEDIAGGNPQDVLTWLIPKLNGIGGSRIPISVGYLVDKLLHTHSIVPQGTIPDGQAGDRERASLDKVLEELRAKELVKFTP